MNEMLFRTLLKRYEAVIEDSLYKIQSFNENNIIIPEHIDITGEVDKLLLIIAEAEDKIKKYLQDPEYHTEEIFELSNVMCEGGCGEYMTVRDEEAGWGMCVSCKFEAMD